MAERRNINKEREELLEESRTLPAGPIALEKLKYLREEYDWAILDYRNSLNILSDTTYEDRKHFLLELIQNADDASYINGNAELTFTILKDGLELSYNEKGFEIDDVIAITGTGSSTKSGKKNKANSFIGEKGIGFKSVFALAAEVEIESYPWHFKLLKEKCIVPEVIYESHMKPGSGTRLRIKFSDPTNIEMISVELEKYVAGEVESFLFLQKLSKFNVVDLRNEESEVKSIILRPESRKGEILNLNAIPSNKTRKYLLYNEEIEFSQELVQERWEKIGSSMGALKRNLFVAALIESSEETKTEGRLFCFLPTKVKLPIPIFLQVDGFTKADRERLHDPENNNWNKYLLEQLPNFLLGAILNWREHELIGDKLLNYIPIEDGEDQLKDVFEKFRDLLCKAPWVKGIDNEKPWIEPKNAIIADEFFTKWFEKYPTFREEAEEVLQKKFVNPKWCDKNDKRSKLYKYGVDKLDEKQAVYILSMCNIPKDLLKDNNITELYKYLLDFQSVKSADNSTWRPSIERTKIVRSTLEKCNIFPMEGKGFICLKEDCDDNVFWVGGNSKRPTGIDGSFDLRMIDNEYTYHVSISTESSEEAVKRATEINERNEALKQLLKFLKVQELTYDTLLTEVQMPWLIGNENASEEIKFNIILSIFNVYKAKMVYDDKYLKMLAKLSKVKFLDEEGKSYNLSELLLPKFLRLSPKDSIFASCGYKTLGIPFEIRERIKDKLKEFREFLTCCGVKVTTEFIIEKIDHVNSTKFSMVDEIRYKAWKKRIGKDYTVNNPIEIDTVELDSGTKKYLDDVNCDIDKLEEVIYSAWVKKFEGSSINTDIYYYKEDTMPGFFKATYLRKEVRRLLIKDELWGGINRESIPVRTISGKVIRCNEAFFYKKINGESLNKLLYKLPLVLVKDSESEEGYCKEYIESLEVSKISLKDLNQLWTLVPKIEYESILKLALELKSKNMDDVGFMIYDKDSSKLRPVLEFKLGTVSSERSPLISLQYGEVGEKLGEIFKLREQSNLDFYKGIFTKVFSDEFKDNKSYQKNFYHLLKSWMYLNSVDRGKIAADFRSTLKEMEYLYDPVVLFNDEELLNTLKQAGVMVVNLVAHGIDEELYELEKAACDLGFVLPDESGELVLNDCTQLSEEENYEFKRLVDGYFSILEVKEISRLKLKIQMYCGLEEIHNKIIKVESAYRILDKNSGVKIPVVLTSLDQKEKRIIAYKNTSIVKLIEDIFVITEFTTRRSAHRDLEEIQKQLRTEERQKTVKDKNNERDENISSEILGTQELIKDNIDVINREDLQNKKNGTQSIDENLKREKTKVPSSNTTNEKDKLIPNETIEEADVKPRDLGSTKTKKAITEDAVKIEETMETKEALGAKEDINEKEDLGTNEDVGAKENFGTKETINTEKNINIEEDHYKDISEEVVNKITNALIDDRDCSPVSDVVNWDIGILPDEEESLKEKLGRVVKDSLKTGLEIYKKKFRKPSNQNIEDDIEISSNQIQVDKGAVDPKEFLLAEYKGKCQLCGTELHLHNGQKWINVYHIVEKQNGAWWADRPFNILGLCPNCHALTKYGGNRDISNIFVEANDSLKGDAFAIEVPEFKGDYYVVSVNINGQCKDLKISKLHLLYFSALVKLEMEEAEGQVAASNE